jgi:hypothetical protein
MPASAWLKMTAHVAMVALCITVSLGSSGCSNSELGSVKVPEELQRKGPLHDVPAASKRKTPGLAPGDLRPVPQGSRARMK